MPRRLDGCKAFFAECGRTLASNALQKQLIANLDRLEHRLAKTDPLTDQAEVRTEGEFKELVQCAKAFRLQSRQIAEMPIELLEQAEHLLGRRHARIHSQLPDSWRILEVEGAFLALIDTLTSARDLSSSGGPLLA